MKYATLLLLILFLFTNIYAQNSMSGAGTASNLLLRFAASARVSGISEAYTGLANDENTILYNPGGLPNLTGNVFGLNHAEWLEDIRIDNIIYGQKLTYNSSMGLSITHMWMPSIQGKDQYGQATESFNVSSSIVQLGVGYKIHPAMYFGVTAKYFQDQLAGYNATGFAFDAGLYMYTAIKNLTLGIAVQNIGTKIKYDELKQDLPLIIRGGFAYHLLDDKLMISTDLVKSNDTDYSIHTGVEYNFQNNFFIRMGNQFSSTHTFFPAYGLGLMIKDNLETSYTFSSLEELGTTHKIGFTFKFNQPVTNHSVRKSVTSYSDYSGKSKNNVQLTSLNDELLISWPSIDYATYNIYVKTDKQSEWHKINSKPQKLTFRKVKKPSKKGTYLFKVTYILNNHENLISEKVAFDVK